MQLTDEQKRQILQVTVSAVVSLILAVLAILGYNVEIVQPQFQAATAAVKAELGVESLTPELSGQVGARAAPINISGLPVRCKQSGITCLSVWNGSDIKVYSDGGSTLKFSLDGATGNVAGAGTWTGIANLTATTITTTNLISQSVGTSLGNGAVDGPTLTFTSDPDTGLYRVGANDLGITAGGTKSFDCTATGCTTTGTHAVTGVLNADGGIAVDTSNFTVDGTSGAVTTASSVTAASAAIGGGYGDTGCSLGADGTLQCNGAVTFGSTLALTGAATLTASPILPSESITPTDGADITIAKVLVTLTPEGATGNSLAACTTGNIAILYNSVNANVVISDTGNAILAGNQTLGQYDTLPLACIGTKWVQTGPVSGN